MYTIKFNFQSISGKWNDFSSTFSSGFSLSYYSFLGLKSIPHSLSDFKNSSIWGSSKFAYAASPSFGNSDLTGLSKKVFIWQLIGGKIVSVCAISVY